MAILALTVAAEFAVEPQAHFGIDGIFGFNAWYALAACAALVALAKGFGAFLGRDEDYYGKGDD